MIAFLPGSMEATLARRPTEATPGLSASDTWLPPLPPAMAEGKKYFY